MSNKTKRLDNVLVIAALLLAPGAASAHGFDIAAAGFIAGFAHPLGGWDHVAAMIAVGLLAARLGGAHPARLIACFIAAMSAGAVLAFNGVVLPAVEAGILASLPVLGALIVMNRAAPPHIAAALVAFFAVFHGSAHGGELAGAAWSAFPGFALSSLMIIAAGLAAARTLERAGRTELLRSGGAGIGALGAALLLLSA